MLECEQGTAVVERRVVQRRDVPDGVGADPQRQRDEGVGQGADDFRLGDARGERRRQPENEQQRRPLGQDHVLEQVDPEQVLDGDGVPRRHEDGDDQTAAGKEGGDAPGRCGGAPESEEVCRGERDTDERFRVPRPRRRDPRRYASGDRAALVKLVSREPSKL